jgi:hypothetical protein
MVNGLRAPISSFQENDDESNAKTMMNQMQNGMWGSELLCFFHLFDGLIKPAAFHSTFLPTLQKLYQVPLLLLVCFFACTLFGVRLFFPLLTHLLIATLSAGHPCF